MELPIRLDRAVQSIANGDVCNPDSWATALMLNPASKSTPKKLEVLTGKRESCVYSELPSNCQASHVQRSWHRGTCKAPAIWAIGPSYVNLPVKKEYGDVDENSNFLFVYDVMNYI